MKKWIGIWAMVTLVLFLGVSTVAGFFVSQSARVGKRNDANGYSSQIVHSDKKDFIIYKNTEEKDFTIQSIALKYPNFETLGTIHSKGVYYLFSYTQDGRNMMGLLPADEKEEWEMPVFEMTGSFVTAGSSEDTVYVSLLADDGRTVTEYILDRNVQDKGWKERVSFSIPEGHFVLGGIYKGNRLFLVQEDGCAYGLDVSLKEWNVKSEEIMLHPHLEHDLVEGVKNTWKWFCIKEAAIQWLFPVLIAGTFLVLLIYGEKNHVIYRMISLVGIISVVVLVAAGVLFTNRLKQQEVLETGVEAGYILEEIKALQKADGTVDAEVFWNALKKGESLAEDILIVNPSNGQIMLSGNLVSGMNLSEYYGEEITELALRAADHQTSMMMKLKETAGSRYVVTTRDFTQMEAKAVLMAVVTKEGIENRIETVVSSTWNYIWTLAIIVLVLYMIVFLTFATKWQQFIEGMQFVAKEKKVYLEKPKKKGGLGGAWGPLDQIGHNIAKLRYERELLYRSYYRFVPKGMDRLLKKTEVADIEIGDNNKINGTMVHFKIDSIKDRGSEEYMSLMTESLKLTHQIREKTDGVFLSAGSDLLSRKVFFEQSPKEALQYAIDLYHSHAVKEVLADIDVVMMVHQGTYHYGITGVQDMMTSYMYCAEEKILDPYVDVLARAGVRIVITEQTLMAIGRGFSVRYLGYVSGREGTDIKLYECLDAYAENKRKLMRNTNGIFQNALRLFYANDFYQARNMFKEVLRLDEQDEIARWYLFNCEHQMNKNEAEVSHDLFENIVQDWEYERI